MLVKSSSPHVGKNIGKDKIMILVVLALLPAAIAGSIVFGWAGFSVILYTLLFTVVIDWGLQKLSKQSKFLWINGSAIVTGLLLALVLPPGLPFWIPLVGALVALGLGKYAFGIGNNIFNPALIGRAFLVTSWPSIMTQWILPAKANAALSAGVDAITGATPLMIAKDIGSQQYVAEFGIWDLFIGNIGGTVGETSALALLIGGIFLIVMKVIDWKIPAIYIGTVAVGALLAGQNVLFHILSGGLLIGAFFMATDYITIPMTKTGRMWFAFGCGVLTIIFRLFSSMPEGVMFSILLMNAAAPIIERFTIPKPFGHEKDKDN